MDWESLKESPAFWGGSFGLLLVVLAVGPFTFILALLLAGALLTGVMALPDMRAAVLAFAEGAFGEVEKSSARLEKMDDKIAFSSLLQQQQSNVSEEGEAARRGDEGKLVDLSVPEPMLRPLDSLLSFVVRDFVEFWYRGSISMGSDEFLHQVRSVMNAFVNSFAVQLSKKEAKDMVVYLIYSTSSTLVRQLQIKKEEEEELEGGKGEERKDKTERERIKSIRRICTEMLSQTLPDPHASNPLLLPLVAEILTLQVSKTAESFSPDYLNLTIVKSLGEKKEEEEAEGALENLGAVEKALEGAVEGVVGAMREKNGEEDGERLQKRRLPNNYVDPFEEAPSSSSAAGPPVTSSLHSSSPQPSPQLKSHFTPPQSTPQASPNPPADVVLSPPAPPSKTDAPSTTSKPLPAPTSLHDVLHQFINGDKASRDRIVESLPDHIMLPTQSVPALYTPQSYTELKLWCVYNNRDDFLAEALQELVQEEGGTKSKIFNLPIHLGTFRSVQAAAAFGSGMLREDAIGTLKQVVELLEKDGIVADEDTMMQTMARIVLNPSEDVFVPLQNWMFRFCEQRYRHLLDDDRRCPLNKNAVPSQFAHFLPPKSPVTPRTSQEVMSPRQSLNGHSKANGRMPSLEEEKVIEPQSMEIPMEGGDIGDTSLEDNVLEREQTPSLAQYHDPWDMVESTPSAPAPQRTEFERPVITSPNIAVSVTDISPPSAYHGDVVKLKKDLSFMIAVEIGDVPGYIVQRAFAEFERLDSQLQKAVPLAGTTPDFPRAFLPGTTMRSSADLTRLLESYLTNLLSEPRYAYSAPVLKFFEKERTADKGGINLFSDLTKGVNRQFTLGQNLAKNTFSTLTAKVPIARRPSPAVPEEGSASSTMQTMKGHTSSPSITSPPPNTQTLRPMSHENLSDAGSGSSTPSLFSISNPLFPRRHSQQPSESTPGYAVLQTEEKPDLLKTDWNITRIFRSSPEASIIQEPEVAERIDSPASFANGLAEEREDRSSVEGSKTDVTSMTSAPESLRSQSPPVESTPLQRAESLTVPSKKESTKVDKLTLSPSPDQHKLSPQDLNMVITAGMSIIEEAYDLSSTSFSFRRGILHTADKVVRARYMKTIEDHVVGYISHFSDLGQLAEMLDGLRDSFWPDGVWYSSAKGASEVEVRTAEMKQRTREEAKRLLMASVSPNIMFALGRDATVQALERVFDMLQDEEFLLGFVTRVLLDIFRVLLL
ncbi:hypothetical protein BT69DRAFT_1351814 [Atractiella rhizophila]|nr:hypothetical protein BT69DRAFT_1351814 [Atractiella rhizophila]